MDLLTVEEFAERMKISRTTVFDWIRKGTLKSGRHYFKIGRVIRFEWGPELLRTLLEDSVQDDEPVQGNKGPVKTETKKPRIKNTKSTVINWDC